jgi:manganese transport protein
LRSGIGAKDFLRYVGPTLLVSIAYMDPGNYAADIQAGGNFGYKLVWTVWLSSGIGLLMQYLSGKLGIVRSASLAEEIRGVLRRRSLTYLYWLTAEAAVASTDLAEFLGFALGLTLLLGLPLVVSAFIASLTVLSTLVNSAGDHRVLKLLFGGAVSCIGSAFLTEVFLVHPNPIEVAQHSLLPMAISREGTIYVLGMLGATVMPHALYTHSYLTKVGSRNGDKERHLQLHTLENAVFLLYATLVNIAILSVSASATESAFGGDLQGFFSLLLQRFGSVAAYAFALSLLASGLASSNLSVLSGQVIMEGFLGKSVSPLLRRSLNRGLNVFITALALAAGLTPLSLLFYSQVFLSIILPTALVPLVYFTNSRRYMGKEVNCLAIKVLSVTSVAMLLLLNGYFLATL